MGIFYFNTLMENSFLIVIPTRKNSSFKNKNLYPLSGIPLLIYTLETASDCVKAPGIIDVVVTTDDHYAKAHAKENKFMVNNRPGNLATNHATLDRVMCYIAETYPMYENYVCLQPTSPLRTATHVLEAMKQMLADRADSLLSVIPEHKSIWKEDALYARPIVERKKNRQDEDPVYIANGAIFITKKEIFKSHKRRVGGRVSLYKMSARDSIDVHDKADIKLAEYFKQTLGER